MFAQTGLQKGINGPFTVSAAAVPDEEIFVGQFALKQRTEMLFEPVDHGFVFPNGKEEFIKEFGILVRRVIVTSGQSDEIVLSALSELKGLQIVNAVPKRDNQGVPIGFLGEVRDEEKTFAALEDTLLERRVTD